MEEIVRLAVKPIVFFGSAFSLLGIIYLGIQLKDGLTSGGGEIRKAIAMIAAGAVIVAFAAMYDSTQL